ncbi:hypothetical protein PR048_011427, partial [Dryococelus australis]
MAETTAPMSPNLPPKLNLEVNVHNNWVRFKLLFMVYLGASGNGTEMPDDATAAIRKKISKRKAMLLLNVTGEDAIDLATTVRLVGLFLTSTAIKKGLFDHFLTEAKKAIKNYGYGDQTDSILQNHIIVEIRDSMLWVRLLIFEYLKLDQSVHDCRAEH